MVKVMKEPYRKAVEEQCVDYITRGKPEQVFSFLVKNGRPVLENAEEERDYLLCQTNPDKFIQVGPVRKKRTIKVPALVKCDCGELFYLSGQYHGVNRCPGCGRCYTNGGHEIVFADDVEADNRKGVTNESKV